jgi:signal transduction histidine kinase
LVQQFESQAQLSVHLQVQGPARRLQPEIETILFRITQEALNNVTRHAQADNAHVSLTFAAASVSLQIQDDGCGFDPHTALRSDHKPHWGLLGIEERVTLVGGHCQINSRPRVGTTLHVNIPLQEELAHA